MQQPERFDMTHMMLGFMGRPKVYIAVISCFFVAAVAAQNAPTERPVAQAPHAVWKAASKPGEATRKLLALQASGAAASDKQYPMPVAVAEKVHQRYLDSFTHPIPEKLGSTLEKSK